MAEQRVSLRVAAGVRVTAYCCVQLLSESLTKLQKKYLMRLL